MTRLFVGQPRLHRVCQTLRQDHMRDNTLGQGHMREKALRQDHMRDTALRQGHLRDTILRQDHMQPARHGICQQFYTGRVFRDQILPKSA